MEDPGSFVAVRRISHSLQRGGSCYSSSGTGAWLGRGLVCVCAQKREHLSCHSFDLSSAQENCLQRLQTRVYVPYVGSLPQHQEALRDLWKLAFPDEQLYGMISEQWKEMGWQGKDPSTDFRYRPVNPLVALSFMPDAVSFTRAGGGGFISLENLLYFARNFQKSFQELLRKQVGDRSVWEYPFAVAGVNITFMLIQMLDLEPVKPRKKVGETFLRLLSENESAFDILYCIAFKLMDDQWLMDFNTVMNSTRHQLERELLRKDVTMSPRLTLF